MIIDHNIADVVVYGDDSVVHALGKISRNRAGLIYCVSPHGRLEGVLTDGDFRRWIVRQETVDLERPVLQVANRDFVSASANAPAAQIDRLFSDRIRTVPLLDDRGRLVAVAWPRSRGFVLGGRSVGPDDPVLVIAEIGNNHNGSLAAALELVDAAAEAGADVVKFQMRDMASLYANGGDPCDAAADLGTQYTLDLLARFQLSDDELFEAFDHVRARGLIPLCTPWDVPSFERLHAFGMPGYKIASADLTNHQLIDAVAASEAPLILSTGMAYESEIVETVQRLQRAGASFALLHCNSSYPAPFQDINLAFMGRLQELGDFPVGYSGHERGTAVSVAAVARGARIIERHVTLDRSWEGSDHKASLLPHELQSMIGDIRQVEQSIGVRSERALSQGEVLNREVLAKSLVARVPIAPGDLIDDSMVDVKSPGQGLQPNRRDELVGRRATRQIAPGEHFAVRDLGISGVPPRPYRFARPWGIPVRYHDWKALASLSNPDLVEIHLSYRDLDLDWRSYVTEPTTLDLVVHAPELFEGDHLLDLTASDDAYRKRSLVELQRVIDLTRDLSQRFTPRAAPLIVTNVGGFSLDGPLSGHEVAAAYERLAESLHLLDTDGIEIIPQTMPPFPWHMGGQRFHNLFVIADDIATFCSAHGLRICLDVSHSKLACTHLAESFADFVSRVAPHTAHLHLADARGVDGEGLQIGDGELDFGALASGLAPWKDISFIPEVWQGHKDDGQGFWDALDRLEEWF